MIGTTNLKSYEKAQKELEPNVWKEAKEFYRDNYGKVYHLYPNGYGEKEVDAKYNFHNNPKIVECKRVSYSGFNKKKPHWRDYIDRIVIDADEGYIKGRYKLMHLIDELKFEYWIIAGTDKPEKPQDSGSIVIMFQPLKATKENRNKFNNLVRCFNLYVGDPLNTGYSHKSPEWKGTNVREKIHGEILDFDDLYNGVLSFYKHTREDVELLYKERKMCEYDKKFNVEVQKGEDEISGDRLYDYYINSHKTEQQTALIQLFRNDTQKSSRIRNRKATGEVLVKDKKSYMKRLIFDGYLFVFVCKFDDDCTEKVIPNGEIGYYDAPFSDNGWVEKYEKDRLERMINQKSSTGQIPFTEKFNVSEKEEKYWHKRVMKDLRDDGFFETKVKDGKEYDDFVLYRKRKPETIKLMCEGLGYTDEEVNHILGDIKGRKRYGRMIIDRNRNDKYNRVEELIEKILNKTIHPNEMVELKELTKPKKDENEDETESRLNAPFVNKGYNMDFLYITKGVNKRKRNTYYVNKNNWILTKQFIIDNYFGGHCYRFNEQIKQYSIVSISQSELLKSDGKYKLSPNVNLEVMVTRMHKKIIKNKTQLKPKPNK